MKQQCHDIQLLLTEFAADALADDEAAGVAGHLAVCDDCRAELAREMSLRETLSTLPIQTAPAMATPRRDALTARFPQPGRRWTPVLGGLAAAALALAIFIPETPGDVPDRVITTPYTPAQVAQARYDARTSLVMAFDIIAKTQRHTVTDVFGRQLPRAISGSLSGTAASPEGGEG